MKEEEETPGRLRGYVAGAGKRYPGLWRALDEFRAERGKVVPMWREWCYVPMHATFAYLTGASGRCRSRRQAQARHRAAEQLPPRHAMLTKPWRMA